MNREKKERQNHEQSRTRSTNVFWSLIPLHSPKKKKKPKQTENLSLMMNLKDQHSDHVHYLHTTCRNKSNHSFFIIIIIIILFFYRGSLITLTLIMSSESEMAGHGNDFDARDNVSTTDNQL